MELVLGDVMRLFKYVFGGLLVAAVVGYLGWQVREKAVLAIVGYQFRNELSSLKRLVYRTNTTGVLCERGQIEGYQLRFVSESEYVMEPVCSGVNDSDGEVKKLGMGVKRLYGSGVMIKVEEGIPTMEDGWVHLGYGESVVVVGFFDGVPKVEWNVTDMTIGGDSPARAACSEWGFSCCKSGVEVGEQTQVRTYDCMNSCFQQCNRLPMVMFFNTEPVVDPRNREVRVPKSDQSVRFGLSVSDDQENGWVEIDFGDGKMSGKLPADKAEVEHEYNCSQQSCVYLVEVKGGDEAGNSLVKSELNKLKVIVL